MQGHVRKRGKNSWAVVIDLGRDPATGKRRRLWRSLKGRRREAEALLVQLLHERDTGIDQPSGKITVGEYLDRWLKDYAKPNTAPMTYQQYENLTRRHLIPALGAIPLTKLRPQHIQSCYAAAGRVDGRGKLSPRSVVHMHRVLREALQHAVKWQLLARNPADTVEPPRPERPETPALEPEQVMRLLSTADETAYGALVHLAVMTGLRQGELLGLRWRDIDLDRAVLHVRQTCQWLPHQGFTFRQPKTAGSRRAVAISPDTVRRIRQHRQRQLENRLLVGPAYQDNDLVFSTAIGTPLDPRNLQRSWRRIAQASELEGLRFHDLRHAHASLMLAQGVHPKVVSERLGHSGIRITMDTYSHVLPNLQAEAAAQLDHLLSRPQ